MSLQYFFHFPSHVLTQAANNQMVAMTPIICRVRQDFSHYEPLVLYDGTSILFDHRKLALRPSYERCPRPFPKPLGLNIVVHLLSDVGLHSSGYNFGTDRRPQPQ